MKTNQTDSANFGHKKSRTFNMVLMMILIIEQLISIGFCIQILKGQKFPKPAIVQCAPKVRLFYPHLLNLEHFDLNSQQIGSYYVDQ